MSKQLDRVYSVVVVPMKDKFIRGSKYFLTFLDECSGHSFARFVAKTSRVADAVVKIVQELETLSNECVRKLKTFSCSFIKWLRTDSGGEYVSDEFQIWRRHCGIVHEIKSAYWPKLNGTADWLNRTLLYIARTMLLPAMKARRGLLAKETNTAWFCLTVL